MSKNERDIIWVPRAVMVTPAERLAARRRYGGMADTDLRSFMEWFEVAVPPLEASRLPLDALVRQVAHVFPYGVFHAQYVLDIVCRNRVIPMKDEQFTSDGVRAFAGINGVYYTSAVNTRGWDLIDRTRHAFGANRLIESIRAGARAGWREP